MTKIVDGQTDRQTDRQTDGRTDKVKTIGLPHLPMRGPNKIDLLKKKVLVKVLP